MDKKNQPPEWTAKERHIENIKADNQKETIVYKARQEKKSKLWVVLNSSFFLWILSSVIVAGLAQWYQNNKHENELKQAVTAIDLEIENRIGQFLTATQPLVTFDNDSTYHLSNDTARKIFNRLWNEMKTPPEKNEYIFTAHGEYQKTSLVSLLPLLSGTLSELGDDVNEAKENGVENWREFEPKSVKKETDEIKSCLRFLMTHSLSDYQTGNETDIMQLLRDFFKMPSLKRWQWSYPYVDCNYKHPFC